MNIRINEALLAATPVILSNKIGASELVLASGVGQVFESGNVASLVNALLEQLDPVTLTQSKTNERLFSEHITPHSDVEYFIEVIQYVLYHKGEKPYPTWFQKNK